MDQTIKEYTKISLHNHFGSDKKNKNFDMLYKRLKRSQLSYDWSRTLTILIDAYINEFSLMAVTNSNHFSLQKYILLRCLARNLNIEILPGVEINVMNPEFSDPKEYAHAVIIFNHKNKLFLLENDINSIVSNPAESTKLEDIVEKLLLKRKSVILVHGKKQNKRSLAHNYQLVSEYMSFESDSLFIRPVLLEDATDFHKITLIEDLKKDLKDEIQINWVIDTKTTSHADRDFPSDIKVPNYIWGENNFENLYYSALLKSKNSKNPRILTDKDKIIKNNFISKIIIKDQSAIEDVELHLSHGLNSIIGPSGSGKTLLLNTIYKSIKKENLKCVSDSKFTYPFVNFEGVQLFDKHGERIENKKIAFYEGEKLYQKIIDAYTESKEKALEQLGYDLDGSKFNEVIKKFNLHCNEYLSSRAMIDSYLDDIMKSFDNIKANALYLKQNKATDSIDYTIPATLTSSIRDVSKKISNYESKKEQFNINYESIIALLSDLEFKTLISSMKEIKRTFNYEINSLIKKQELILTDKKILFHKNKIVKKHLKTYNETCGTIVQNISEKKQEISTDTDNIINWLKEKYLIKKKKYIPNLSDEQLKETIRFENDTIEISNIRTNIKIDEDNFLKMLPEQISINKSVKKIRSRDLSFPYDLTNIDHVQKLLDKFYDNKLENIIFDQSIESYIDYDISIKYKGEDIPINEITAGMMGKIHINKLFTEAKNKDIIVYDQPDNNLEKSFVLNEIANQFLKLRKTHQIIITTHEPLLVINADSNNIIGCVNDKNIDNSENKIVYKKIDLMDSNTVNDALERLSTVVDGSIDAIHVRSKIYGGMKHGS